MTEPEVVRKHPLAKCEECPLYKRGKYVPSSFPTKEKEEDKPQLAFIGEAPGKNEIKAKKVFIGMSGKLLDGVLKHYEIDRSTALLTNAAACHYPTTQFSSLPISAVNACRDRLVSELKEAKVEVAATLGANAMKSLMVGKEGITIGRAGGPRKADYIEDVLVVPTFHPAAALRDHLKFPLIVNDLGKLYDGVWDMWKDPNYKVIKTVVEANHALVRLWREQTEPLVTDTESGADKDETFGGAIKEVLCIGVWEERKSRALVFPVWVLDSVNRKLFAKLLLRNGIDGQNIKYDNGRVLNHYLGGIEIPIRGERMAQSYALYEMQGIHSLDYMGREYQGAPQWKHWVDDSMERGRQKLRAERKAAGLPLKGIGTVKDYSLIEPEVLHKYNAYDVAITRWQRDIFDPMLEEQNLTEFYQWLMGIEEMLVSVEQNGMPVDLEYNAALETEFRGLLDEVEFSVGEKFNPNSPIQVKKVLNDFGVFVDSTEADTLKALITRYGARGRDDVVDFCNSLLSHRASSKTIGTYITGLRKTLINGIAHPSYQLFGSVTGRLTCKGPNLQNIPRGSKLRRQFVAEPGKIFVHADFAQAELRVMAWLAKDERLRELFCDTSIDIFNNIAISIWGKSKFESWDKEYAKNIRGALVKPMAYGTAYGRGPSAIAESFGCSLAEAKRTQDAFLEQIPGVVKYQQEISEKALAMEDLINVFGRRRRFRLVTDLNKVDVANEAKAHMPQATSNDICMTAARELYKQGLELKNLIHDAVIAQCDIADADEVGRLMRKTMVETAELITGGYVPFKVDVDTAYSYGDF